MPFAHIHTAIQGCWLIPRQKLKAIHNKKIRAFYEEQNRRLDDWLEVDAVVSTLADDVLDSMAPQDLDHDGVAEDRGPLGISEENVECFLPEDEREKRRKSARHVKWAINVCRIHLLSLVNRALANGYSD